MRTVYKYVLPPAPESVVAWPLGSRVVRFGPQGENLFIWAEVQTDNPPADARFKVVGTGQEIATPWQHVASCEQGALVWHLYRHTGGSDA